MGFQPTVEVVLFLTSFAFAICDSVNTNLIIFRTCYVIMGYDQHNCSLLGKNNTDPYIKELETRVQPKADMIIMVKGLIDGFSNAALCLLVGAWSDRFGRKPVLLMSLTGFVLQSVILVVFSAIDTVSPWYFVASSVPVILTGGGTALLTVMLAYVSDVTAAENRGLRMGIFEGVMGIGVLIGSTSSSYVFYATNYETVYGIMGAFCLLALLYTLFLVPETVDNREEAGRFKGIFQLRNFKGMFRTAFRSRPLFGRAIILLMILALSLYFVAVAGDSSVMFLFLRAKFSWTLQEWTWYSGAGNAIWFISTAIIVYVVHHRFHVGEAKLILLGFLSLAVGTALVGVARVGWFLYVCSVIKSPHASISPMTRSLLSKLVEPEETAKVFALFTFVHNLLALAGSPIYTTLYNATLKTYPAIFLFLSAGIFALNGVVWIVVMVLQKRGQSAAYLTLEIEEEGENEVPVEWSN